MSATTPPLPPRLVDASNAPLVHCSPRIRWVESRTEGYASSVMASQTWWPVQALADSRGVCMACLGPSADRIAGLVMGIRDPAAVVLSQAIWSTSHLNWTNPCGCLTQAGLHGAAARFAVSRKLVQDRRCLSSSGSFPRSSPWLQRFSNSRGHEGAWRPEGARRPARPGPVPARRRPAMGHPPASDPAVGLPGSGVAGGCWTMPGAGGFMAGTGQGAQSRFRLGAGRCRERLRWRFPAAVNSR